MKYRDTQVGEYTYRISSYGGECFGVFRAHSPELALVSLHREAGYGADVVWVDCADEDAGIQFADLATEELLGGLDDWDVVEITEAEYKKERANAE